MLQELFLAQLIMWAEFVDVMVKKEKLSIVVIRQQWREIVL